MGVKGEAKEVAKLKGEAILGVLVDRCIMQALKAEWVPNKNMVRLFGESEVLSCFLFSLLLTLEIHMERIKSVVVPVQLYT